MNTPRFGAEASLCKVKSQFLQRAKKPAQDTGAPVQPALDGDWNFLGCHLHCDEYTRCDEFGCIPPISICSVSCWGGAPLKFSF
jgi:hypothetical protein